MRRDAQSRFIVYFRSIAFGRLYNFQPFYKKIKTSHYENQRRTD